MFGRRGFLVLNLLLLGPPSANSATLEKEIALRTTIASQTFPEDYEASSIRVEAPVYEPPTSDATSGHSNCESNDQEIPELLNSVVFFSSASVSGSRMRGVQQWNNTRSSWAKTGGPIHCQGNPIGVAPKVPILVTRKDRRLGKLKINLVVQDKNDTDAEGSDEPDGEELEITTPIQKRKIQSTSLSPVQTSATIHEVIRSLQQPQPPIRSPTMPSTLASTSTNIQPPVARTSRDPMSPEPEFSL
ncbi:hypothetical protein O181_014631 [Austropuccinia psidii MF-1]|uniref:Uncharacterized protein n=1 Tax=Austropuccinia psidii MF-1 TaxID=1389203 RepID=A0A9Q3BYG7_9BASI|nr:hypothetical protein [Austropuccinia psidii MF-1]